MQLLLLPLLQYLDLSGGAFDAHYLALLPRCKDRQPLACCHWAAPPMLWTVGSQYLAKSFEPSACHSVELRSSILWIFCCSLTFCRWFHPIRMVVHLLRLAPSVRSVEHRSKCRVSRSSHSLDVRVSSVDVYSPISSRVPLAFTKNGCTVFPPSCCIALTSTAVAIQCVLACLDGVDISTQDTVDRF